MIGINTAIYSPSGGSVGIGFAVPVETAKRIVPTLIARGYISRPWLGIATTQVDRRVARAFGLTVDRGIMVTGVYRGTGAASSGLRAAAVAESLFGDTYIERAGDVIVAIDGRQINTNEDIQRAIADKKPGDVIQVEVVRQGSRVTVPLRLSERPQQGN
jgi:S1-C subfamily serine protease